MSGRVIRDNKILFTEYENLGRGDAVVGRIRIRPGEEHILLDLESRQVKLVPSAVSQLCSRSKVFQARLLSRYMVPHTRTVYDQHDALTLVNDYGRETIGMVVCKLDRANAGQGILLFSSAEEIFNHAVLKTLQYPFVAQPFVRNCRDVRVVILGEVVEAYTRYNPNNFRHNLHCGGESSPYELENNQLDMCREIMERAGFPYAHIDLLLDPENNTWLSEINLRGGLRGASLSQKDYLAAIEKVHDALLAE